MIKFRTLSFMLALAICIHAFIPCAAATVNSTQTATQQEITDAILALQEEYPDGMIWTNQSPSPGYLWVFPGSLWNMSGCAAFAALIQDSAIGSYKELPPSWQRINADCRYGGISECTVPYSWDNLWPGDIIRFEGHSVIVVEKREDCVTVAEGNYAGTVKWGRKLTKTGIENSAKYVLTRFSKAEPLMPYTDLPKPGHWSYAAVTEAILNDIAEPISATLFGPNEKCTRSDVIAFLWAASGRPEPELNELRFTDVPEEATYRTSVLWAVEQGITSGTSAKTFSPDALCTRAHALTFLWRAAGDPPARTENYVFDDVAVNKYYYSSVLWALENGITSGTSATTFSPDRSITRAEALTFLYRIKGF